MEYNLQDENRRLREITTGSEDIFDGIILHVKRDTDRLSAIQRELREETGYTADEWTVLGDFHPAPAYSDEFITMYMARGLRKGDQHLDADEFLDVHTVPLKDLVEEVMAGTISDAKTQVCILKAARILGL